CSSTPSPTVTLRSSGDLLSSPTGTDGLVSEVRGTVRAVPSRLALSGIVGVAIAGDFFANDWDESVGPGESCGFRQQPRGAAASSAAKTTPLRAMVCDPRSPRVVAVVRIIGSIAHNVIRQQGHRIQARKFETAGPRTTAPRSIRRARVRRSHVVFT